MDNTSTLSVRNFVLFLCCLARYWSYSWASLDAKTCSRLKQGWWEKIKPEISMSSWKFPGGSPDPIIRCLLWTYFTACQREQTMRSKHSILLPLKERLSGANYHGSFPCELPCFLKSWVLQLMTLTIFSNMIHCKPVIIWITDAPLLVTRILRSVACEIT